MRDVLSSELRSDGGPTPLEVTGWMELEFEQCQGEKLPVVLLRIAVDGLERVAPTDAQQADLLRALVDVLRAYPRTGDLYAVRDGRSVIVLLPRTTTEAAELMCRLLIEAARKLALPGARAPVRASLSIGVAEAQADVDLYFETLILVAFEGVLVASASGSECFVHTQLYGLYQRKLEREKPRQPRAAVPAPAAPTAVAPAAQTAAPAAPTPDSAGAAAVLLPTSDPSFDAEVHAEIQRVAAARPTSAPLLGASLGDLEQRLLEMTHAFAQSALERALAAEREKHAQEVALLQRRITKLARTLEDTEEELRHVENHESVDRGVASAYRFVQGLSAKEDGYDRKLGLLAQIVEANLALQKNLLRSKSA